MVSADGKLRYQGAIDDAPNPGGPVGATNYVLAAVKDLKAGQKVTLLCHDNDKGEHQGVAGVKAAAKK